MKLLAFVLAFSTTACATLRPPPPPPVGHPAERVKQSVIRITGESFDGSRQYFTCTGFAIDVRKYMTAAHCVPDLIMGVPYVLKADGRVASPIKVDPKTDLAVILVDLQKPALTFRSSPVKWLETVWGMGFGYGFTVPITTRHTLQARKYNLGEEEIYPGNAYESPFIGGMSGGPIFDQHGLVVGVVQLSSPIISYGVDTDTIAAFLKE